MIVNFAKEHQIDLTVIGPEVPLCNGLANDLEAAGLMAFGPTKRAATLEGSKAFSKDFMIRHNIPTLSSTLPLIHSPILAIPGFPGIA